MPPDPEAAALAAQLATVGREVRDAVLGVPVRDADADVVRVEGGDAVFGVDARADVVLLESLRRHCGRRWPGRLVMEGRDSPAPIGGGSGDGGGGGGGGGGPWVYLADPVDGTRPWLAGKRSAWVLLGAGRRAATLEDLQVGAAVELPTARARLGRVAWAAVDGPAFAEDDDLTAPGSPPLPATLASRSGADLERAWVTVARFSPGDKARIGRFEDQLLQGLEVYEDPYLCSGGQLMGLASGADAAVLDPRPLFHSRFCAHPYDLAALVVARAAGVIVEAIPPGPLRAPLDPTFDVAWAGYANETIARRLRPGPEYLPDP